MAPRVRLLGSSEIHQGGDWQPLPRDKRGALLVYLAYSGDWVGREQFAFLFWPDKPDREARRNLRQLLKRLKDLDVAGDVEIGREQLRWNVDSDVAAFRTAAAADSWDEALSHYRGDLCSDFLVADAVGFDSWLEQNREALKGAWQETVLACSEGLRRGGRNGEAARLLAQLWNSDPLDEQALHAYLGALQANGEREAALDVFERFRTRLEGELGIKPLAETLVIVDAIRSGAAPETVQPGGEAPQPTLPEPGTPFFERGDELGELEALLADPGCRLLAVVGAGGSGKTRLALELARRQVGYEHGVHFVPLVDTTTPDLLVATVAAAIGFDFFGKGDPREQLGDYLHNKRLLLLLDGFEHLTEGVGLLAGYLEQAPGLELLLTTREAPDLPQAWIYRLAGMDWAEGDAPDSSHAFRFFLQAAQRSDPRYRLRSDDVADIAHICRQTEGLPLALEMAATWVRQLTPGEIGEEIQLNLDFLHDTTGKLDGMRAVFDHSWNLLAPEQQRTLACLATFRGGFDRRAAQAVAGASLYTLLSLVGKSLLRKERGGRYDMHELTRNFAFERLARNEGWEAIQQAHAGHFCNKLHEQEPALESDGLQRAVDTISQDLDNLRAAWHWATERAERSLLLRAARPLGTFLAFRSLFDEGERLFAAVAGLPADNGPEGSQLLAEALGQRGSFAHHLGDNSGAAGDLQRSLELFEQLGDDRDVSVALHRLAQVTLATGDYRRTEEHARHGLALARNLGYEALEIRHLLTLGQVGIYRGEYVVAQELHETALELSRRSGNRSAEIAGLDGLGTVSSYLGHHEEARRISLEAHGIKELAGNPNALARSWYQLGADAFHSGDYATAEAHFRTAYDAFSDIGNRRALAATLQALGGIEFSRQNYGAGKAMLREAISLFEDLDHSQGIAEITHKLALFTKLDGDLDGARRLYQSSLKLAREIGAQRDEILCLDGLGHVAADEGAYDESWSYTCAALERALATSSQGLMFHCLINAFRLLRLQGQQRQAHTLASLTLEHPAANASIRAKAEQALTQLCEEEGWDAPAAAPADLTIEGAVAELLAEERPATVLVDDGGPPLA